MRPYLLSRVGYNLKTATLCCLLGGIVPSVHATSVTGWAQHHAQSSTLLECMHSIEKQTGYVFIYPKEIQSELKQKKVGRIPSGSIDEVCPLLFEGTDLTYQINEKQVVVKKLPPQAGKKQQTTHKVTGIVTDESTGETLIGVSVSVKGDKSKGVITDAEGRYTIDVTKDTQLEFAYIGYKTQTLLVGDLGILNVRMTSADEQLGEVVVVGAGTQKKVSVTGAITSVKGSELRAPSASLTANIAGRLAGVVSMAGTGEPGSVSQFYIRGISTFGGRTEPLILLDGVEISIGDLDRIPAESIESFSILKDASATAIYGARGANGVMLVTTKSGKENTKAEIRVSFENSYYEPVKIPKYADGVTYMSTYNETQRSRHPEIASLPYSDDQLKYTAEGINPYVFPDVDWMDLIFKDNNMNQRMNMNLQGGGNRVTYYLGLQSNHTTGLINVPTEAPLNSNYNRWDYIFQNNIGYKVTNTTKLDLRINAQVGKSKGPLFSTQDLFNSIRLINPVAFPATFPAQDGENHIYFGRNDYQGNPYADASNGQTERSYSTLNATVNLNQDFSFILQGLSMSALVNLKAYSTSVFSSSFKPYYYEVIPDVWDASRPDFYLLKGVGDPGYNYITQDSSPKRNSDDTFYLDTRLNYQNRFGDHTVSGMLMYMMREFRYGDFPVNVLPKRNQGLSGRFTYDYKNKYLAEFNFGYNGTERLSRHSRYEFFPAASVGWVVSSENFWEPLRKAVDHFKIRASYGIVGSDETGTAAGRFLYLQEVNMSGYSFATGYDKTYSYAGPKITSFPVEGAHWERSKKFNLGVDFSFFNQVNATFEFFNEKRDRILMERGSFAYMMGYGVTPWSNVGKVTNSGFEASVNWRKDLTKDLYIDLRGSFTYNRSIVDFKDEPNYPYVWQTAKDKPLQRRDGFIALGLFQSEEEVAGSPDQSYFGGKVQPGDIKYQDVNGDGVINNEDKVMISPYGNMPRIQYGFGLSVNYKKLDFSVFFNGSAKRTLMLMNGIDGNTSLMPFTTPDSKQRTQLLQLVVDDYWSESNPNPDAAFPRLGTTYSDFRNNVQPSTFWTRNGSFLRFKTLEVGYSFPHIRMYFSGDNLAVFSPFKHWDPESWVDRYPFSRTFNLGFQLNF